MRRAQKKQAEDFATLLEQAHDEIKAAMEKDNLQMALRLLYDCHTGAAALGNFIETVEGETAKIIPILHDYCELVQKLSVQIEKKQFLNIHKAYKELRHSLTKVSNGIRYDIKEKLEVVFLPYKVSMWDSLESIWKAADEDPDCDAYVIPIPYYDRASNGDFAEMHDEANLYPDYIPVIWYEEYDFEKRKPDMVFIHNPYDDGNYVTSVLPFFYSENLKRFTEHLIYVPYFISEEILPENTQAAEQMRHLYLTKGVINADKVIVQSESMKQAYVNVLTEHTGKEKRRYWETKVLGLGSPKVDKVLGTEKEEIEIPRDWLELIRRPDGSRKKVVLYNTSVGEMLQYDEKMIEKIRNVLKLFEEKQDEAVLLWRPHPLMEATLRSMRPRLWEAYRELVDWYRCESNAGKTYKEEMGGKRGRPWGIYDGSSELHRAIKLSSAYIGDPSSVATLYQKTGKPILLLSVEPSHFESHGAVCENGYMFFCFYQADMIFKMNQQTGKIEQIGNLPPSNSYLPDSYILSDKIGEELFFISWSDFDLGLLSFNLHTGVRASYKIDPAAGIKQYAFRRVIHYQNKLFLMPHAYPAIVEFDLILRQFKYYPIKTGNSEPFSAKGFGALQHENLIYLPCHNPNALLVFDCDTGGYTIDQRFSNCNALCFDGENYWAVGEGCMAYRYHKMKDALKLYDRFPACVSKNTIFYTAESFRNFVIFAPAVESVILKLEISSGEITELELPKTNSQNEYFILSREGKEHLLIFSRTRGSILKYHVLRDEYEEIKINLSQNVSDEMALPFLHNHKAGSDSAVLVENEALTLRRFLTHLEELMGRREAESEKPRGGAGQKIYDYMKKSLRGENMS